MQNKDIFLYFLYCLTSRRQAIYGLLLCCLRKCANNEKLDRPYTVQVGTKINVGDRTLFKL